jgi:phosphatidate phosphatase LPIN
LCSAGAVVRCGADARRSRVGSEPARISTRHIRLESTLIFSPHAGTITKSDLLGHIAPAFGIQWAQKGVAQLLTRIQENNYKVLYLTARPIGQADATKSYLKSVNENGVRLPVGPVITSPDGMFRSLHREVIMRKPEEFKIDCLSTIKNLFPEASLPFYAGFGNRHTDVTSYQAVDIPDSRIMIINPQGEVHNPLNQQQISSYDGLRDLCDLMFPPVLEEREVQPPSP